MTLDVNLGRREKAVRAIVSVETTVIEFVGNRTASVPLTERRSDHEGAVFELAHDFTVGLDDNGKRHIENTGVVLG